MYENYIAVIQAGGKGTRMTKLTKNLFPKPMLLLNGKPMIQWQIENIKKYGIKNFVIIIGFRGEKIREFLGNGENFGIHIQYIEEREALGSAGALYYLKSLLHKEQFLLIYGDVMFDLDWGRILTFHETQGGIVTILTHPNEHPADSDLLVVDSDNKVIGIDFKNSKRNYWYDNCVNSGIFIMSVLALKNITKPIKLDMEKGILIPLIEESVVYSYRTSEYIKDAGTVKRFNKITMEQSKGIWHVKNLSNKQKCVFLDRDGTINRYKGLISNESQFELENGVEKAIRILNESGYLVIVITNQSVVARGMCNIEDVNYIHKKMQTLLGQENAYIDDCVFCPHHPDKGYPEENLLYKEECNCRKPAIGLIKEMEVKYNIDLSKSYFVGDSTVDIQTGKNAGLRTILLSTGQAGLDGKYDVVPDIRAVNLLDAVNRIMQKENDNRK